MPAMKLRPIAHLSVAATAALALALSACGSDSGSSSADTVPTDVGLEVDAGPGIKFGSTEYETAAGTDVTIALVNKDTQKHSLVVVQPDGKTLPGELEVGKSGSVDVGTFDLAAGTTYELLCLVPGHENMKATLTVP